MTEQEKNFFEMLDEKAKEDPMVRVLAASDFIANLLKRAFTSEKGTRGDMWCYMVATLTGISVASDVKESADMLAIGKMNQLVIPKTKLETEAGIFWIGGLVDKYIYDSPLSVWNIVTSLYSREKGNENLPDLKSLIENNAKKMGSIKTTVWDISHKPHEEISAAKNTYEGIRKKLEPYKINTTEYHSVFAMALFKVIMQVEDIFPKDMNCLKLSMETMMYYAHMDV